MRRTAFVSLKSVILLLGLLSCGRTTQPAEVLIDKVDAASTEAREDSLALAAAVAAQRLIEWSVSAKMETTSARASAQADAADDPAIWVNSNDRAASLVFGSNKTGGLAAYDLNGKEVAYYAIGNVNNVDIIDDVMFRGERITLLGCSNRTEQSINLFSIDPQSGELTNIADTILAMDGEKVDDVYGFCFGRVEDEIHAIVNGKNGRMQQFRLLELPGGFDLELIREVQFPSQTEGMIADSELGWLYVGEEAAGIWKLPLVHKSEDMEVAEAASVGRLLLARVGEPKNLVADVEGLTMYRTSSTEGYLLASIQGSFSYAVFERSGENTYLGSFKIIDAENSDGVEETDGLDVINTALPGYPRGMLVVQDGFNYEGGIMQPQNFKYIDIGDVLALISD